MSFPLLKVESLSKSFGSIPIVENLNFEVALGGSVAITGPSGCGKSTLLHMLGGIEPAERGTILLEGSPVTKETAPEFLSSKIAYVFQSFHLLEDSTVLDNLLLPAKIARKKTGSGSVSLQRALTLLRKVGMEERKESSVSTLSGGEKQRVAIARALMNDPLLLLADEPTGNLDPKHAEEVWNLLLSVAKNEGKTVIIVTHNHELAQKCDAQFSLQEGTLTCT